MFKWTPSVSSWWGKGGVVVDLFNRIEYHTEHWNTRSDGWGIFQPTWAFYRKCSKVVVVVDDDVVFFSFQFGLVYNSLEFLSLFKESSMLALKKKQNRSARFRWYMIASQRGSNVSHAGLKITRAASRHFLKNPLFSLAIQGEILAAATGPPCHLHLSSIIFWLKMWYGQVPFKMRNMSL